MLGADSMSTISAPNPAGGGAFTLKTYSHAHKVFQVANLPIGVMTYGIGNMGQRSIGSYILECSRDLQDVATTVRGVADRLLKHLSDTHKSMYSALPADKQPGLGIYVAGYDPNAVAPVEWEFVIPRDAEPRIVRPQEVFGAAWRGMEGIFARLFFGMEPQLSADLGQEKFQQLYQKHIMKVIFDPMPLQDAIDFAHFILQTTIGMSRFMIGAAACGGPIDIATITEAGVSDSRFTWVSKKEHYIDRRMY